MGAGKQYFANLVSENPIFEMMNNLMAGQGTVGIQFWVLMGSEHEMVTDYDVLLIIFREFIVNLNTQRLFVYLTIQPNS